ncbi:YdeI/OmpD-associated family protein [Cyclobacterium plantarum]|uniref:DUF1905 domain-containing protein n=1 Tax=Cyclobacterium plantarum TaxID=2716263 RepID=A0ABX0HC20_9BACT|nr:YdeI/OmpD-associated family protein [Cyclobacterium plantarum]NHE59244.1 DUF1905 domain-containing protein [Cyclobacterium plantarum]
MEEPLVNQQYLLQQFPNKGGWTYAEIPEIPQDKHAHFGWVKVKGSIDGFEIKNYRLQAMGNGRLFLPVKASIRKKIQKKAGDFVTIILFKDESPLEIPEELVSCLKMEPKAYQGFLRFTEGEQKAFIEWIYAARTDETKVKRIAATLDKSLKNQN